MADIAPPPSPAPGRLRLLLATGGGVGYAPVVSGTFGSVPGVALAWGLHAAGGWWAVLAALVVITAAGTWAADAAERHFGRKDPREVVVDEIAGQMMTLLFVPLTARTLASGFVLFRIFDVLKPYPARSLERLPGGPGIMADDLAAGIYANLLLQAAVRFLPALMGTP